MEGLEIVKITREYVVINGEKIWFDEPFKTLPLKNEFELWLENIKVILEKALVTENE